MIREIIFTACLAMVVMAMGETWAQQYDGGKLEITADKEVVWNREAQTMTALGSAKAAQGNASLEADEISAFYSEDGSKSGFDIRKITARGSVVLKEGTSTLSGAEANYDIASGQAEVSGSNVLLVTDGYRVTAGSRMTYDSAAGVVRAYGRVKVVQGDDTIESDTLSAYFYNSAGRMTLSRLEADGNVVITTPDETITGSLARYDASSRIATMTENVVISQGQSRLQGSHTEVNLETNTSRLFADIPEAIAEEEKIQQNENGRVKGTFYPKQGGLDLSGPEGP